ncbi:MAG: hypothetical protein JJT96_14310 [Opitutales bacterium]|nr:hypothetical protein [Opitutales bacterium]
MASPPPATILIDIQNSSRRLQTQGMPPRVRTLPFLKMKRDYNALASNYLKWLGIINLIGLNLGGLFYLWLAGRIKEKSHGARKFLIIWLLIICPLLGVLILSASVTLGEPLEVNFFNFSQVVPLPISVGFVSLFLIIHMIPGVWLCREDVRKQYFEPFSCPKGK